MENFEVPTPILNSPFGEPKAHWWIEEGKQPEQRPGRRPAGYYYRPPKKAGEDAIEGGMHAARGEWRSLEEVNRIRQRMSEWRAQDRPGITRTTRELLDYWTRDGRHPRLFFAQVEAAETIIFLNEARADFLQGIDVPLDEPSLERKANGFKAFKRLCCKMATGSGKTTVMAMLSAWSILNKISNRGDARFSDVVVAVCPNVTIRGRLQEIDPRHGDASVYRTRDLVPERLMADLGQGRVIVTNWHVFEPQGLQIGGVSAKVSKAGVPVRIRETVTIAQKTTTMRGGRYMTPSELDRQVGLGLLTVLSEERDKQGNLKKVEIEAVRYVESDTALLNRILGREVGGKQNILILNDEAHHAYRIRREADENGEDDDEEDADNQEEDDYFVKEATVWIDGLDKIHRYRGINFCVDLSATPYFIGRTSGAANTIFPWVVSDFGLTDAIESGLVKIPQLAVRDTTGAEIPGYFNIWRWIITNPKLTRAERGSKRGDLKPEAVLRFADTPIRMLASLWDEDRKRWAANQADPRPPVFILVCKNTRIAKVVFEWIAEGRKPTGIPSLGIDALRNSPQATVSIRVDTKVVQESESDNAKSDEVAWMRLTLDTVGKLEWPRDGMGRPIYPEGFEDLAAKLGRPTHPPGRDIRCIVSVGMLTEGWDCNTVTHIVGLRPFMSQLLCEQVVGRGLRRQSYEVDDNGLLSEEVAKVFGVPFEVIPFKANAAAQAVQRPKQIWVQPVPEKEEFRITFPRVEGYRQSIRNRIAVHWDAVANLVVDPKRIPPEVEVKGLVPNNQGRQSLSGPGKIDLVSLNAYRRENRLQKLTFEMARDLTRDYVNQGKSEVPAHVLFPQIAKIIERYVNTKVEAEAPADKKDAFLAPYYGWMIETLLQAIRPDTRQGEAPEVPVYERSRGAGSTSDVKFMTSRPVREAIHCHLNYVVADTKQWEQSATFLIDSHPRTMAFVKNAQMGFAIPYFHNGQQHEYVPDFIIKLANGLHLILETKGYDDSAEVKRQAAERWCAAVNADGQYGAWSYAMVRKVGDLVAELNKAYEVRQEQVRLVAAELQHAAEEEVSRLRLAGWTRADFARALRELLEQLPRVSE